jgi:exodeoxyribonuclease VII large subunit
MQLSFFDQSNEPKSVTELTHRIRLLFERDPGLQDVWVEGEVSNYKRAASGHLYFSLKDANAQLKVVMWKADAVHLNFEPSHGDQIIAHGHISVYDSQGVYQLYADLLQPVGLGDLNRQFELLKAKMEAEGLFDSERKRPIPYYPQRIGIVTSPDAAGFQDVLNILTRRYPAAEIILSPTQVQGATAPPRIVAAIEALNRRPDIDVMLIVRGGGSLEDLWCFNDERVVRAVANSRIPTITGVGHEIDFTLVDFAADHRAPTPSAAAEIATPDSVELLAALEDWEARMQKALSDRFDELRGELDSQKRTLRLLSPMNKIANLRQSLDDQSARMSNALRNQIRLERRQIDSLAARLEAASPEGMLRRGFALVTRTADGKRMTSVQDAAPGTSITVQMQDGTLTSRVNERTYKDKP